MGRNVLRPYKEGTMYRAPSGKNSDPLHGLSTVTKSYSAPRKA